MRRAFPILVLLVAGCLAFCGCLPNDPSQTYACTSDAECRTGWSCVPIAGLGYGQCSQFQADVPTDDTTPDVEPDAEPDLDIALDAGPDQDIALDLDVLGDADGAGDVPDDTACDGWWDPKWSHRHPLEIENLYEEELQEFTVLIRLDATRIDYGLGMDSGADLRFVDPANNSVLPHHIETYDVTGDSWVWVRVPSLPATQITRLYMYYGNPEATNVEDPAGSFDASTVFSLHLDETSGSHVDAARGATCTWTDPGTGTQDATGQIGGGVRMDGATEHLHCGQGQLAVSETHTITAWIRRDASVGDPIAKVLGIQPESGATRPSIGMTLRQSDGALGKWVQGTQNWSTVLVPDQIWTFVAARGLRDATTGFLEVSIDGGTWTRLLDGDTNHLAFDPTAVTTIGDLSLGADRNFGGHIDEVRISATLRSDIWVRTQFISENDQGLVLYGGREDICP